jgi:CHAD domain-containing protein
MAKARPVPGLSCHETYGSAAAKVLLVRTEELSEHRRGVLDTNDIEGVHAMRVATRRLRATLEVFEPCLPGQGYSEALADVKRLADALGERRDRDVMIEALSPFAAELPASDRRGLDSLVETLRTEQAEANNLLAPYVEDAQVSELCDRLGELAGRASVAAADESVGSP